VKLNKDKLPIKYILGIEKDLPDYPTALDVLQAEVKLCNRNPERYKGSFTYHALKTYRFPDSDHDKILESALELVNLGLVEQTNSEPGKEAFKILINPFE
tara:strand:- start:292 stop:591 length:300 start_codon:yes stop_codon:yes gene_type:complete